MSNDSGTTPKRQPRYKISVAGESSGWVDEVVAPSDGRQRTDGCGSLTPGTRRFDENNYVSENNEMSREKSSMPHLSRSRSLREFSTTGGYSFVKDLEMNTVPIFQITTVSAGDFNASDNPDAPAGWKESQKNSLSEAIEKLMTDNQPNKKDTFSSIREFGSSTDPENFNPAQISGAESQNIDAHNVQGSVRQKQRAQSEPARTRKPYKPSEEHLFGGGVDKSIRSPSSTSENRTHEGAAPQTDPDNSRMPPATSESDWDKCHFVEPGSRPGDQFDGTKTPLSPSSESMSKPKRKKKTKSDALNPPYLTMNADASLTSMPPPENLGGETAGEGPPNASNLQNTGFKFGDISTEKDSRKKSKSGNSPQILAKGKKKKEQASDDKISGSNEGQNAEKPCRDLQDHGRSQSQEPHSVKGEQRSPRREKSCELKIPQPCIRRKKQCSSKGNLFRCIASVSTFMCLPSPRVTHSN